MMRISTKGRYALRIMLDLAQHDQTKPISLRGIADRQSITSKYMEGIMALLLRHDLLVSTRGKMGGYRLARTPEQYTVYEILCAAEGTLAPVQCLSLPDNPCPMQVHCTTLPVWQGLEEVVKNYLKSVTLADILRNGASTEHCSPL